MSGSRRRGSVLETWPEATLSEVAKDVTSKWQPGDDEPGVYLGLEHLTADQREPIAIGSPSDIGSTKTRFDSRDVLFGKLRPYLRKVAVAPVPGVCSTDILVFRTRDESVLRQAFLYRVLSSARAIEFANSRSAGTRMPRASAKEMKQLPVLVPPVAIQDRIADLLDSLDLAKELAATTSSTQSEVREALADRCAAPSSEGTRTRVDAVVGAINGASVSKSERQGTLTYIDIAAVEHGVGIRKDAVKQLDWSEAPSRARRRVAAGDLLISTVRPYLRASAVVPPELDGAIASTGFAVISPDRNRVAPEFLWAVLTSRRFVAHLTTRQTGSNYPAVKPNDIAEFEFILPDEKQQHSTGHLATALDAERVLHHRQMEFLASLRSALTAALLSGEHKIPESYDRFLEGREGADLLAGQAEESAAA